MGIALKVGDTISNGAHVLAYSGIHSDSRNQRAIVLCWWPTHGAFAVWTIEYAYGAKDMAWYPHDRRYAGLDFARALEIYIERAGSYVNLPRFIY